MGLQADSKALAQSTEQAALSCQECRRRKVKCDRQLPICGTCIDSSMACIYPAGPLKPGPKPGFNRRPKKRRLEPQSLSPGMMDGSHTMLPQYDTNAELGQSFASHFPKSLSSMNDSASSAQDCAFINSNERSSPSVSSQNLEKSSVFSHRRLSWMVYPNHEPAPKLPDCVQASTMEPLMDQLTPFFIQPSLMDHICRALQTDERDIHHLYASIFALF